MSGCTVPLDSTETKLGRSDQEAFASEYKNSRVVIVPCWALKCVPTAILGAVDISEVPGCHLLHEFSVRVKKITSGICVS